MIFSFSFGQYGFKWLIKQVLFVLIICFPFKNFAQTDKSRGKDFESENRNNIAVNDSTFLQDSLDALTGKKSNNFIDTRVKYDALDSIILSSGNKKVFLYKGAKVEYGDILLEADYIEYDQENNYVFAKGVEDSLGNLSGKPKYKDKGD